MALRSPPLPWILGIPQAIARPAMHETIRLDPLTDHDFDTVARLADTIWRGHYGTLISMAQIDYMLDGRYTAENLGRYIDSDERWMRVLRVDGIAAGYCSWSLGTDPDEVKLEQLYLLPEHKGKGLGSLMMRTVEDGCRALGRSVLFLTVNKGNVEPIAIYRKSGFEVREEAVFDIGNGYVMDDYVMAKRIAG
jgi:ribosomal protein S18 acetylase RimI-like enzyme